MKHIDLRSRDSLLSFAMKELEPGKQADFLMLLIDLENDLERAFKEGQPERSEE